MRFSRTGGVSNPATASIGISEPWSFARGSDDKDALANPIFTIADATIISRKITGFSGAALTNIIAGIGGNDINAGVIGATIAGGGLVVDASFGIQTEANRVTGDFGSVGGGFGNTAGEDATVSGGFKNLASGVNATVSGGDSNTASGRNSIAAGGGANTASEIGATVSGGFNNLAAGIASFAAGKRAKNRYAGAFMWADNTNVDFKVAASEIGVRGWTNPVNTFNVRATGGARFVTAVDGTGFPTAGPYVNAGSGTWNATSDRAAKTAITPINAQAILRKVAALPISSWQYLSEKGVRHIGPMSQDFKRLFAVGPDDRPITTINADGVALVAIQGLNQIVQKKDAEITALKRRLAAIEKRLRIQ